MAKRKHPDRKLTLRQAFERHYDTEDLSPRTVKKLGYHLTAWEKLTENPPIGEIDDAIAAEFRKAAMESGRTPATISGIWGDVRAILRRVGPRETRNPAGLNIIAQVPYMKPVRFVRKIPPRIPLDDISRLYVATRHAQNPRTGIPAAEWWRCLIVVAYTTGLRRSDLFSIQFEDIDFENHRLSFTAQKTGKADEWPLHPEAVKHIARVKRPSGALFSGMYPQGGRFSIEWRKLLEAAKIPANRRFTLHDLRRSGSSEVERVRPGLGKWFLQHASRNVSDAFYINQMDELSEAISEMRLPAGFASGPKMAARAEQKARAKRVEIHHSDFATPFTPDPSEWQFAPGEFMFRGVRYRLVGDKWRVLKMLAEAGQPLEDSTLSEAAGVDGRNPDEHARHRRAIVVISELRKVLREAFGLPDDFDPVPCVYRRYAGRRGRRAAFWTISLPADLNSRKDGK